MGSNPMVRGFSDNPSLFGASVKSKATSYSSKSDKSNTQVRDLMHKLDRLLSQNKEISIEVPLAVDGKQIAKASARYMENEINTMNNRKARLSGAL